MMRIERLAWLSSDIALVLGVIHGEVDARSFDLQARRHDGALLRGVDHAAADREHGARERSDGPRLVLQ